MITIPAWFALTLLGPQVEPVQQARQGQQVQQAQPSQPAQPSQQESFETLELRVASVRPRQVVVDRGMTDGLLAKDRVTFRPRDGRVVQGTVVAAYERDAVVELDDPAVVLAPGTKGDVRIPSSRRPAASKAAPPQEAPAPAPVAAAPAVQAPPDHPPWGRQDDALKEGEPLLARIRPFRPEEREPAITGRVYSIFDYSHTTEGPHADTFARTGTSLLFENPAHSGGELNFDGEVNYRHADVPPNDNDGEERSEFRLDRFSYTHGGNRFSHDRFEFGRFLQYEMPEFGVLDGGQWTHRLAGGDTFGASAGFLPDPDSHQDTGDDLEFMGYYRWVADESEQLSLAGGYQKTFHHLDADRDLVVGKVLYLPVKGWDFTGTAWVDLYTAKDEAKGAGLGLTQAYLSTGKHFDGGSSVRFSYTHQEFPETQLDLFTPVTVEELANAHSDRAAVTMGQRLSKNFGVFASGGAWVDQEDVGGDGEVGMDIEEFAFKGSRLEFAGFGTQGRFSTTLGGRAGLGGTTSNGSWLVGYEFTYDDITGFAADNNSLPQNRIRANWDLNTASRWSISVHADLLLFDTETSYAAGLFLQRSF